jgi:hypothetical protein
MGPRGRAVGVTRSAVASPVSSPQALRAKARRMTLAVMVTSYSRRQTAVTPDCGHGYRGEGRCRGAGRLWGTCLHSRVDHRKRADALQRGSASTDGGFNIFEGSRRIARLLEAVWLVCVVGATYLASVPFGFALLFAIGGLTVISVLQIAIGWIVRGFMGIPRGHDHRRESL